MESVPELVRYHGWNRREWVFLCVVDGWIDHTEYKTQLREWDDTYTCFAIQAWTREQQKQIERLFCTRG